MRRIYFAESTRLSPQAKSARPKKEEIIVKRFGKGEKFEAGNESGGEEVESATDSAKLLACFN
jgi:hypothetical protein